jgi:hypothetical protein
MMNHSLPGANAGYITRDRLLRDHLPHQQERISDVVAKSLTKERDASLSDWLGRAKIDRRAQAESADQAVIMAIAA